MHLIGPIGSNVRETLSREPHFEAPMSQTLEQWEGWKISSLWAWRGWNLVVCRLVALSLIQNRSCDFSQLLNFSVFDWFELLISCLLGCLMSRSATLVLHSHTLLCMRNLKVILAISCLWSRMSCARPLAPPSSQIISLLALRV